MHQHCLNLSADRGDGHVNSCEGKIIGIKAKREHKQRKNLAEKRGAAQITMMVRGAAPEGFFMISGFRLPVSL